VPGPTPAMMARAELLGAMVGDEIAVAKWRVSWERRGPELELERRVRRRANICIGKRGRGWKCNQSPHGLRGLMQSMFTKLSRGFGFGTVSKRGC